MTARLNTLTRRRWLRLLAPGSASAVLPGSWTATHAATQGARDLCATDGAFTQPLYVPGTEGWLARLLHCHNLEHEDAGMMLRVKVG